VSTSEKRRQAPQVNKDGAFLVLVAPRRVPTDDVNGVQLSYVLGAFKLALLYSF
jgi:hypothetical protein